MGVRLEVYFTDDTGIQDRDEGHHADGYYDHLDTALRAASRVMSEEEEVTEVRIVKQSERSK